MPERADENPKPQQPEAQALEQPRPGPRGEHRPSCPVENRGGHAADLAKGRMVCNGIHVYMYKGWLYEGSVSGFAEGRRW